MRVQVSPYCEFGRDTAWMTQAVIESYIFAWLKGERFGDYYIAKVAQADPIKMRTFREVLLNDPDFEELRDQIWNEMEYPEKGSIEYHIWQIERQLEAPGLPAAELKGLYAILGQYRGWLVKPGEKLVGVNVNVVDNGSGAHAAETMRTMNANDAERVYFSLISKR